MNKIYKYSIIIFALSILAGLLTSCNDDDDEQAPRLFRPQINDYFISQTYFGVSWDRYQGAIKYELQLSVDSFKTIKEEVVIDSTNYRFENLWFDTQYQLRIRSIGNNIMSEYFVAKDVKTLDYTTQLNALTEADVIDTQAKVTWNNVTYNHLKIYHGDDLVQTVNVTNTENQKKQVIVKNLEPVTSYRVEAYALVDGKEAYRGKKPFKTVESQVFEGDVEDLRNLSADESLEKITPSYLNELATNYPSGVTVVLNGGIVYNISSEIVISSNVTFVTGLSFAGYATMAIDGSFTIAESTTLNKIKFDKIFFTEGSNNPKTSSNYGGTYIFNINKSGAKLSKLDIESCIIKYKRGVIRMQTESIINEVSINNCVIDSIGGYGVVNNANDKAYIGDIKVQNSTISHAEAVFACGKKLGVNSITLENVTTCFAPKDAGYMFDYNKNTIPGGIMVKKCIFGISGMVLEPGTAPSVNVLRCDGASATVIDSYRTNDYTMAEKYKLDLSDVGESSKKLFSDPVNNNYTVKNSYVQGKAGDPRWW